MENENNSVELVEEQKTEKEDLDFPEKVKKLFNMEDYK
jgi:hypothetical protein